MLAWTLDHPNSQWLLFASQAEATPPKPKPVWSIGTGLFAKQRDLKSPTKQRSNAVQQQLVATLTRVLRCEPASLQMDRTFRELGVNSLMADEIVRQLRVQFGLERLSIACCLNIRRSAPSFVFERGRCSDIRVDVGQVG